MKKFLTILIIIGVNASTFSQVGIIKESLTVPSQILGRDVEYSIYLPHDYQFSERNYPVVYLLHGFSDDESGWTQFGEVKKIADSMIDNLDVTDMIIVMPDGGVSLYVNSHDGKVNYEDFFVEEFMPMIEKEFRIRSHKRFRAIAGLSMGGHGALMFGLKYPELFAVVCPISASVSTDNRVISMSQSRYDGYFGPVYGMGLVGSGRITEHYKKNSGLHLMEATDADKLKRVRFYIDCGDDDFLIDGNLELSQIMTKKKIKHELRVRDGVHNWTYWREALSEVLKFASMNFHQI